MSLVVEKALEVKSKVSELILRMSNQILLTTTTISPRVTIVVGAEEPPCTRTAAKPAISGRLHIR